MKPLYLYLHIVLFIFQNFTKGNLVETCFWLNLAVKEFINIKGSIFRILIFPYSLSREIFVVTFLWVVDCKLFFKKFQGANATAILVCCK